MYSNKIFIKDKKGFAFAKPFLFSIETIPDYELGFVVLTERSGVMNSII